MAHCPVEDNAAAQPISRWLQAWDQGLLLLTVVSLLGMTGYLLWPQPVAHLKLQTMSTVAVSSIDSGLAALPDETETQPTENKAPAKKSNRHHRADKKKPLHPPVLNLNTASVLQLQLLPGIGPKMAERILEYRKSKGAFQSAEQVMDVKGIGTKKFEKLKPYLKT